MIFHPYFYKNMRYDDMTLEQAIKNKEIVFCSSFKDGKRKLAEMLEKMFDKLRKV